MLNQITLVGRIVSDLKIETNEENKKYTNITIAVPRNYKNSDGIYETDFINVIAYDNIAENTCEWCKKTDLIGIKGRVETIDNKLVIKAERITFLTSRKVDEE